MLKVQVAELLKADGHDAVRVSELGLARADDSEILQRAIESNRILLTVDGDFGDWAVLPWKDATAVDVSSTWPDR
jgi:predicted nuclease of predicted toxin-antitoxin system